MKPELIGSLLEVSKNPQSHLVTLHKVLPVVPDEAGLIYSLFIHASPCTFHRVFLQSCRITSFYTTSCCV